MMVVPMPRWRVPLPPDVLNHGPNNRQNASQNQQNCVKNGLVVSLLHQKGVRVLPVKDENALSHQQIAAERRDKSVKRQVVSDSVLTAVPEAEWKLNFKSWRGF